MTAKDIERLEKQLDALPGKLIEQINPIITREIAELELRITRGMGERVTATEQSVNSAHLRINGCVDTGRDNGIHINLVDKDVAGLNARIVRSQSNPTPAVTKKPREVAVKLVVPMASIVGFVTGLVALLGR